jgi:glycosyltransferase involved in cell wall biosynthesis
MSLPNYILLSSIKDEGAHLTKVLAAVATQSVPPLAWYITDDGSTDASLLILRDFARRYPFIRLKENPRREGRNWAAKDRALNASYELARQELGDTFGFVGAQDGDQAPVNKDFFEILLAEAAANASLGVLGGIVYESREGKWRPRPCNASDSVPGSAFFRRSCFEATGGYLPLEYGGSDWLIQVDAGRAGFGVKVMPECVLHHYRRTNQSTVRGAFKAGLMDASLGSDFLFELLKCARRLGHAPLGLPGLLRFAGYGFYRAARRPLLIGPERYAYLRSYQRAKIAGKFGK